MSTINPKIIITIIIESLVFSLVPFIAAGTLFWFYGWIFLILLYIFSFVFSLWALRHNPGLLEERVVTGFKPDEPIWDKAYIILLFILVSIWWILIPLDAVRFHWSQMPTWLHVMGAIVLSCSFYLMWLTYRENPYLASAVRIQEDRVAGLRWGCTRLTCLSDVRFPKFFKDLRRTLRTCLHARIMWEL